VLALVIVLGAALTGSGLVRGVVVAVAFFLVATAWNWWRFRRRLEQSSDR
jgi:membrane protein implicated in regulation of membrane protease activity